MGFAFDSEQKEEFEMELLLADWTENTYTQLFVLLGAVVALLSQALNAWSNNRKQNQLQNQVVKVNEKVKTAIQQNEEIIGQVATIHDSTNGMTQKVVEAIKEVGTANTQAAVNQGISDTNAATALGVSNTNKATVKGISDSQDAYRAGVKSETDKA